LSIVCSRGTLPVEPTNPESINQHIEGRAPAKSRAFLQDKFQTLVSLSLRLKDLLGLVTKVKKKKKKKKTKKKKKKKIFSSVRQW